jgi:hypothetical protein
MCAVAWVRREVGKLMASLGGSVLSVKAGDVCEFDVTIELGAELPRSSREQPGISSPASAPGMNWSSCITAFR